MAWRKWLVRGLVLTTIGGLAGAVYLYMRWTNPEAVRQQVIEQLHRHFVGVNIRLESARMRLLGGISFNGLRLSKAQDPGAGEVANIPSGVIYPDKEKVLDGKFAIRKIELHHPQIVVRRDRDGAWNFQNLLAPANRNETLPTLDIRQGTVMVEDDLAAPNQPPITVTGLNITLINDPLASIKVNGRAACDFASALQIQGTIRRATNEITLSLQANGIPLGRSLVQRLEAYAPRLRDEDRGLEISGTANVQADIGFSPQAADGWNYNFRCQVTQTKLRHPELPLPLDEMAASLACIDGQLTLQSLTARCGSTEIEAKGWLHHLSRDADLDGHFTVRHWPLTPEMDAHLSEDLHKIKADYDLAGAATAVYHGSRRHGEWTKHCVVQPEDVTATFSKFRYTLAHLAGAIEYDQDTAHDTQSFHVDLKGMGESEPIFIKGGITGKGPHAAVDLRIWGDNIVLDEKLMAALSPAHRKLARSFHPTGQANFVAAIQRKQGDEHYANHFTIRFHDATVRYDVFGYPLSKVSGLLEIEPNQWTFSDFHGEHNGCEIETAGGFRPDPANHSDFLTVKINGKNVLLDDDLRKAFDTPDFAQARHAWDILRPSGKLSQFRATVRRTGELPPEVDVDLTATEGSIKPKFFDYQFNNLSGTMQYAKHWVNFGDVVARHGDCVFRLKKGQVFLKPDGGVWADVTGVQANRLVPDEDLLHAMPPVLRKVCKAIGLTEPIALKPTRLTLATSGKDDEPPDIYWDGALDLHDSSLRVGVPWTHVTGVAACRGRYDGHALEGLAGNILISRASLYQQPFRNIQGALEVRKETPEVLVIPGLHAEVFGGEIYGPVRVEFGPKPRYEVNLTASQVRLEEFGKLNLGADAPVSGQVTAQLHLQGDGPEISNLSGRGSIDVENGRMYNLPLLLDLLKFLSLQRPDGTAFEEAHATFTIQGPRVGVDRFDLFGNSISLRGQGAMNLDGTDINLDFFAVWGARIMEALPHIVKEIPQELSRRLLKIKMRGRINDVHFTKEPVPVLVEPLKGLLEKMAKPRILGSIQEKMENLVQPLRPGARIQEPGTRSRESARDPRMGPSTDIALPPPKPPGQLERIPAENLNVKVFHADF